MFQDGYGHLMLTALVPVALIASWYDYRWHRVPNWLNALVGVAGLGTQTAVHGWLGLEYGVQGMLVGFGLLVALWAMNGMGAGDVKLMAALGCWMGPHLTFYAVLVGGLLGGVIALGMIVYHRNWAATSANLGILMTKMCRRDTVFSEYGSARSMSQSAGMLPYAIPLSIGSLLVVVSNLSGWWKVI